MNSKSLKLMASINFHAFDGDTYAANVCSVKKGIAVIEYFARLSDGEEVGVTAYIDRKDWNRLTAI